MTDRQVVAGWSRTRLHVEGDGPILDLGSGAFPNEAAEILCDGSLEDHRHRHGLGAVVDRPFVIARAEALPFRDGAFSFAIASHIAEHVDDPAGMCSELARVARAGYIETPSPLADVLLDEEYHIWRVSSRRGVLTFQPKRPQTGAVRRATSAFYKTFYAGRSCSRPTYRLPRGPLGRALSFALTAFGAILNRLGLMHTRYEFSERAPMHWAVGPDVRERVAFIDRAPSSGFMRVDQRCLDRTFAIERIEYPGWPTPSFVARCVQAALRCDSVYCFFASEQAVVPVVAFRLRGRPAVVTVGGYDVANDRAHGYGLAANGRGFLPRAVLRLSTRVLAMSSAAAREAAALQPRVAGRTTVVHLAVDPSEWTDPVVQRDPDLVVTLAYVTAESWWRKGIDRFVAAAKADPARRYVLIGAVDDAVRPHLHDLPSNLVVTGHLRQEEVRDLLWQATAYVQLSAHEGFGVAMAEAMLCGCTPVVADQPALREVAGHWAFVAPSTPDVQSDVATIQAACVAEVDRPGMRADIADRFSLEARAAGLAAALTTSSKARSTPP